MTLREPNSHHQMISPLLLALAASAIAAPLPPMPTGVAVIPIKPSTVLRSPKDASQPKSTPMFRVASGISSYPDGSTIWITVQHDLNFFGCNTNNPDCVLYDAEQIEFLQLAGQGAQLEFSDTMQSQGWGWVGQFYPPPNDIINGASYFYPNSQRPAGRFYRVVPWTPDVSTFRPTGGGPILNKTGFPSLKVWTSPRRR